MWFGIRKVIVLLPYEITLLSNDAQAKLGIEKFYYLMKLHYSQTVLRSQRVRG